MYRVQLKEMIKKLPYFPGVFLKYIPFSWKLGNEYLNQKNKISKLREDETLDFVIDKLNFIVNYALNNFEFYRNFYGVNSYMIKSIDDFASKVDDYKENGEEYSNKLEELIFYCVVPGGISSIPPADLLPSPGTILR